MEQAHSRTITEMWERYRDVVVGPVVGIGVDVIEVYRQAFWAGAGSVLDILVRLQELDEEAQNQAITQVFSELDAFKAEVMARATRIMLKHFGEAS